MGEIRALEEKVKGYADINRLRASYLAHLQRLHEIQSPMRAIAEYLVYLWGAMLVFLLINVALAVRSVTHAKPEGKDA